MPDVLSVENLSAGYGPVKIIEDVSLNVGEGEVVAVIGPNGAGKNHSDAGRHGYCDGFLGTCPTHGR
jgi:ABC-type lipopolysaccharide export system ATPase subunit